MANQIPSNSSLLIKSSKPLKNIFASVTSLKRRQNICECSRVSELYFHGKWYSGTLDDHRMILLRKMKGRSPHPPRDICTGPPKDVAISSMVSGHKNFMKLVGCCIEFEYPVIVYYGGERQYSPVDLNKIVSWRRRMKIAEEVATALACNCFSLSSRCVPKTLCV